MEKTLRKLEERIAGIKSELAGIGEMRPGSLTQQRRGPKKTGAYYQLSYSHRSHGHTEYVRAEFAPRITRQIATYKRFRRLVDEWVHCAIEDSKLKMELARRASAAAAGKARKLRGTGHSQEAVNSR